MAALGCGAAFVAMVRRLLTDTTARAHVNGYTSTLAAFEAGVRQGCPLAPLLYLFFAQGLLALLRARGVGIDVSQVGPWGVRVRVRVLQRATPYTGGASH